MFELTNIKNCNALFKPNFGYFWILNHCASSPARIDSWLVKWDSPCGIGGSKSVLRCGFNMCSFGKELSITCATTLDFKARYYWLLSSFIIWIEGAILVWLKWLIFITFSRQLLVSLLLMESMRLLHLGVEQDRPWSVLVAFFSNTCNISDDQLWTKIELIQNKHIIKAKNLVAGGEGTEVLVSNVCW